MKKIVMLSAAAILGLSGISLSQAEDVIDPAAQTTEAAADETTEAVADETTEAVEETTEEVAEETTEAAA